MALFRVIVTLMRQWNTHTLSKTWHENCRVIAYQIYDQFNSSILNPWNAATVFVVERDTQPVSNDDVLRYNILTPQDGDGKFHRMTPLSLFV